MGNPVEGIDQSNAPYVIVSSDTHAGLYVEDYRPYLEASVHAEFDEWLATRHQHRAMVEELNGDYVERWESDNAGRPPGGVRPRRPRQDPRRRRRGRRGDLRRRRLGHRAWRRRRSAPACRPGMITDPRLAWAGARAHNRWLEEFCATNPPRRAGVALVPITHGIDESVREVEALADKPGIKGIMIPTMWHDQPSYGHESYDPVWAACAEAGLVVHTHSGEADTEAYNDNMAQFMLEVAVLDPPPAVAAAAVGRVRPAPRACRYAPVECGSWWVGDLLFKTDVMFGGQNWKVKKMASATKGLIERLPSEYVGHQRVHRGVGHEQGRAAAPATSTASTPSCGAPTTPTPRAPGPTRPTGSRPTSGPSRWRRPGSCSGSTQPAATASTSTPSAAIAADIGPTPEDLDQDLDLRTPPDAIREARFWFDDYGIEWKG